MSKIFFRFPHLGGRPTLETVYQEYGFEPGEVDPDYGVVLIDPAKSLYVVLVEEAARQRVEARLPADAAEKGIGFFANPRIEPFGPPEP